MYVVHRLVDEAVYDPRWCCACGHTSVKMPNFDALDIEGIKANVSENDARFAGLKCGPQEYLRTLLG